MSAFGIRGGASYEEIHEDLSERLAQAEALIKVLSESYEDIKRWDCGTVGHYLWTLDRLMDEASTLFTKLPDKFPLTKTDEAA